MREPKLLHLFHFSLAHATAVLEQHGDGADTHQNVHDPLDLRPGAQEHMDDVPVTAEETAQADKTPVDGANPHEPPGDHVNRAHLHATHHRRWKGKIFKCL